MDINQSLSTHKEFLLGLKGVIGTGKGTKWTGGMDTGKSCVVVFVREKLALEQLDVSQIVPTFLPDGVKTDVIEVGEIKTLPEVATAGIENRQRHRPVVGGVSISPGRLRLAGTGGLIVYQGNVPCLLSNNHVLRLSHAAIPQDRGSYIRQPSSADGGKLEDTIGNLWDWVEIAFPGPNEVDCAIAKLLIVPYIAHILGLRGPNGIVADPTTLWDASSATWARVRKSGRSSGVTEGRVIAIHVTIQVNFGRGLMATFVNQIATSPMAIPGDSGSALLTENSHVAGLVFAGSPQISLANPIGRVFELLNLTLPSPVTPIEDILPQLGEATIWGWDNEAKTWSSFDTTVPEEFRHFMKLRFLIPGNGYWIWVNRDTILKHNGFKYELFRGWSLIGWR